GYVAEPAAREAGREEPPRVRHRCAQDPAWRAADLAVAREEARAARAVEVWDHDFDRDQRDGEAGRGDQCPLEPAAAGERVPEAEPRDHECDLLLRRRGEP